MHATLDRIPFDLQREEFDDSLETNNFPLVSKKSYDSVTLLPGGASEGRVQCKFGLNWHFTLPGLKADPPRGRVTFVENPCKTNQTISEFEEP